MKAAPLLGAWLHRLRATGVRIHARHRWIGWGDGERLALRFATRAGEVRIEAPAWILALGGGSWPRLGSDGAWVGLLMQKGIDSAVLVPDVSEGSTGILLYVRGAFVLGSTQRDWTAIAMGAYDTPTSTHLERHIFVAEKGDYHEIADALPQNPH